MAAVCLDGAWDRWPSLVMCLEMVTMGDEGGQRAWSTALVDGRLSKQTPCVSFSTAGRGNRAGACGPPWTGRSRTWQQALEGLMDKRGDSDGGAAMACTVETMRHARCPNIDRREDSALRLR